jgi:hypothetical protein
VSKVFSHSRPIVRSHHVPGGDRSDTRWADTASLDECECNADLPGFTATVIEGVAAAAKRANTQRIAVVLIALACVVIAYGVRFFNTGGMS